MIDYLCKKKITNRPTATSWYFMIYVVIEKDNDNILLHGPFVTDYAAHVYKRKLESFAPTKNYEIQYLVPEKNLPK